MAPAMMGDEKLVPDEVATLPEEFMTVAPNPRAATSGLTLPSADGPWLLKLARTPNIVYRAHGEDGVGIGRG